MDKPQILTERLFDVPDGGWVGFSPHFPACARSGETAEDAAQNAAAAIVDWLAAAKRLGRTIPLPPRAILHLRADG